MAGVNVEDDLDEELAGNDALGDNASDDWTKEDSPPASSAEPADAPHGGLDAEDDDAVTDPVGSEADDDGVGADGEPDEAGVHGGAVPVAWLAADGAEDGAGGNDDADGGDDNNNGYGEDDQYGDDDEATQPLMDELTKSPSITPDDLPDDARTTPEAGPSTAGAPNSAAGPSEPASADPAGAPEWTRVEALLRSMDLTSEQIGSARELFECGAPQALQADVQDPQHVADYLVCLIMDALDQDGWRDESNHARAHHKAKRQKRRS